MSFIFFAFIFLRLVPSFGLNTDGVLLLSFKYSILSDPLSVLQNWNYDDETPCSWTGVTCTQIDTTIPWSTTDLFRVTSLILPDRQLLGSVTKDLGLIQHLRHLDLSNNFFNGSLPLSIFNATELQVLSLSNNVISGELPDLLIGQMRSLQILNLSDNALAGNLPKNLTALKNLTVVSLRSNYFSGSIPSGFTSVEVLDLSSNLFNGSLPLDFGGDNMRYLNLSSNKVSGSISPEFAKKLPQNVTIDLSFNNLTGAIPVALPLVNQRAESFSGNIELCGKPLKNICSIPSTLSTPPNVTTTTSPAIAVIPKSIDSVPVTNSSPTATGTASTDGAQNQRAGLKPSTIAAIAVADLAGIGLLALVIFYVYQFKKRKALNTPNTAKAEKKLPPVEAVTVTKTEQATWSCLKMIKGEETSDANTSSDSEQDSNDNKYEEDHVNVQEGSSSSKGGAGTLVTVDGDSGLDVETLFKASAYILGTSSSSIVYKAVLSDGTALAVRRIGEACFDRLKDFESQARAIAKLKHPNLVKLRGFYWAGEEKLLICDYVSNGCLASFSCRKPGSSSGLQLSLGVRLKIARGVARGLAYIHEKKHVHGNIKPSNILLNSEMEPMISDLGLDRLVNSSNSSNNNNTISYNKASNSSPRLFGSQRSASHHQDPHAAATTTTNSSPYSPAGGDSTSPYQAPELLKTHKANPKWDVYSYGIVLLELLSGRVLSKRELGQYSTSTVSGSVSEEKIRVLRMADVGIRGELESREDALLACFKLGFSCASFVPHKRPSMKEAAQILDKIPCYY